MPSRPSSAVVPSFHRSALCRCVKLPNDTHSVDRWHSLIDELRKANKEHADQDMEFQSVRVTVPFTDVIIKDSEAGTHHLSKSLQIELDAEFADADVEMATVSANDPSVDACYAYFGYGVFAPMSHENEVANVEFSWLEPPAENTGPIPGAGFEPIVPGIFSERKMRYAGWYAGQKAMAISFDSNLAPVRIGLPAFAGESIANLLRHCVLFIGRQSRYSPPVFMLRLAETGSAATENIQIAADGDMNAAEAGEWVKIMLIAGPEILPLWFRLRSRTGSASYRTKVEKKPVPTDNQDEFVVSIKGFILPEVQFGLIFSKPSRWLVHFDHQLDLRQSELSETFITAVSELFGRLAAARHTQCARLEWESAKMPGPGRYDLPLGSNTSLLVEPFPADVKLSRESDEPDEKERDRKRQQISKQSELQRRGLRNLYRKDWCLVTKSGLPTLAEFRFSPGTLTGDPLPQVDQIIDDHNKISLEWLNRTAQVQSGGDLYGLGKYWNDRYESIVERKDKAINVETWRKGQKKARTTYNIRPGDRGFIGPLFIQFESGFQK